MKICLVAELFSPHLGGVEFALSNIVEGLAAQGIDVTVITSRFDRKLPRREGQGRVSIIRISVFPFFKRLWFILFSLLTVFSHTRKSDIIQGSTFAGAVPASLAGWSLGKKTVLLVHEIMGTQWFRFEPNPLRSTFYWLAERIIVRLPFDRYVAVSNHTKRTLVSDGVSEQKIEVIYHGDSRLEDSSIDKEAVRAELGFQSSDYIYLALGRTGVSKGLEYFAEAIPEIVRRIPNARFVLIFSKYDGRIWRRIVRGLSRIPTEIYRLSAPVSREKLADYVWASDCVVIPSRSEGFGFSAREACNAGKTVVATNAGSLPEVVHGKHIFVQPGSADALVDGCWKAYRGEVGYREPIEFDWKATIAKYYELYKRLTGQ
jgi:glycosyltransferase involved in cell wall biosynthesis